MRTVLILAMLAAASTMLGGCFHHNQAAYAEPLPAPVNPPLK